MNEIWKDVPEYEGYYIVSNHGNVRSVDRVVIKSNGVEQPRSGRVMTQRIDQYGYKIVRLSKYGDSKWLRVHRLVAAAFIDNPNQLQDVNHIDFDRANNSVENLEWVSHGDNVRYSISAGRHFCNRDLHGENNPNYHNKTLKKYFEEHPDEKQRLARKGGQNGNAVAVKAVFPDGTEMTFGYLRECAIYMIENGLCASRRLNSVADRIAAAIKLNKSYSNCQFTRV